MHSAHAAITRWRDVVQGKTNLRLLRSSSVFAEGDKIYSFGHHFELGRVLRNAKGEIRLYLLNGERVSMHTSQHQSTLRNALRSTDVPKVIIPFAALEEAGINLDSILLIHDMPERSETIHHRTHELPQGAHWETGGYIRTPMSDKEIAETIAHWNEYRKEHNQDLVTLEEVKADDRYAHSTHHHRWDDNLRVLHSGKASWSPEVTVTKNEDGTTTYEWTTHQHWLGDSLIRARVEWMEEGQQHHRWATFLSSFDYQEPAPLYFLCELPYRARPQTVDEAYEALKPDPVKMAEQMGRSYTRQGDIFAVTATTVTRRKLRETKGVRMEKYGRILGTNHVATEVAYLPGGLTIARGCLYHRPSGRVADHVRRRLGDGKAWHVVVKNTVPTAGRR